MIRYTVFPTASMGTWQNLRRPSSVVQELRNFGSASRRGRRRPPVPRRVQGKKGEILAALKERGVLKNEEIAELVDISSATVVRYPVLH